MKITIDLEVKEWRLVLEALSEITHGPKGQGESIGKFSQQVEAVLPTYYQTPSSDTMDPKKFIKPEDHAAWDERMKQMTEEDWNS